MRRVTIIAAATTAMTAVAIIPANSQSVWDQLREGAQGVVRQMNPIEQGQRVLNLGGAIASGDPNKAREALGGVLLNSPSCLACPQLARQVAPNLSPEQINRVVGTGFLAFAATGGDPVLVILAAGAAYAEEVKLRSQQESSAPQPAASSTPPSRAQRSFNTTATCIVRKDNIVWAGSPDLPALRVGGAGATPISSTDIRPGDVIEVRGPDTACPGYNPPISSLTTIRIRYSGIELAPNDRPGVMKFFIVGNPI